MRKVKLIFTAAFISACASAGLEEQQGVLVQWKGAHIDELLLSYGPPRETRAENGSHTLIYRPPRKKNPGLTANSWGLVPVVGDLHVPCKVEFTVNAEGKITSATLARGKCKNTRFIIQRPSHTPGPSGA